MSAADVTIPEGCTLHLVLFEADGTEGVVDLSSMASELLSIGAALAGTEPPVPSEEGGGSVLGRFEVSDEVVFTWAGEVLSHETALEYLSLTVVDALRRAVAAPA